MVAGSMEEQNNKNLILAMVLSAAVMIVWFVLLPAARAAGRCRRTDLGAGRVTEPVAPLPRRRPADPSADAADAAPDAVPEAPRLAIDTPKLSGTHLAAWRADRRPVAQDLPRDDGAGLGHVRLLVARRRRPCPITRLSAGCPGTGLQAGRCARCDDRVDAVASGDRLPRARRSRCAGTTARA